MTGATVRELRELMLPLVTPFRTSFGTQTTRRVLVVRAEAEHGGELVEGWGECVAADDPTYSSEYVDGAALTITTQLVPRLHRDGPVAAADVADSLAPVKGHPMAKAALEMAILDAELRATGRAFSDFLGATRSRVPSGVSVGIHDSIGALLAAVEGYLADGYVRIKLKIEPGWDLEPVAEVRRLIGPDVPLQVDANTAYGRGDIDHLCRLDEYDLLLIEQPFGTVVLVVATRVVHARETLVA